MTGKLRVAAAASVLAASAVAFWMAPAALGQERRPRDGAREERRVEILPGRSGTIGVSIRDVAKEDAERAKLPAPTGVLVEEVRADGPAAKAGIRRSDVIVEFDGERVRSADQFTRLVRETAGGRVVKASVMREGKRVEVELTPDSERMTFFNEWIGPELRRRLDDLPRDLGRIPGFQMMPGGPGMVGRGRLGIGVQELTPELAEYFGVKDGVLVTRVAPDTPAAKVGLKAGDVITAVNDRAIHGPGDLVERLADLDGAQEATLRVMRDRKELSFKVRLEDRTRRMRNRPA